MKINAVKSYDIDNPLFISILNYILKQKKQRMKSNLYR
jgi:hypothetical protein